MRSLTDWSMYYHRSHPFRDEWMRSFKRLRRAFGRPMKGSSRIVFRNGDVVYKLPLNGWGQAGNEREFELAADGNEYFARCWVYRYIMPSGIMILGMEWVEYKDMESPGWWQAIDGGQVGYTKDGRLVAYDFALN